MTTLVQDLRYAFRQLGKTPGFTAVAVLTLALGIGANTAIFSLINAVLLRPLPYEKPDRLVLIWESAPFFGLRDSPVAPANYVDWRARSRSFEEMGAEEDTGYRLTGQGTPEIVLGARVTAGLLRALRVRPLVGRIFRDDEDQPGAAKVALISERFWRLRFGSDPQIAGKTVRLNDASYTIAGVLPAGSEPPVHYRSKLGDIWTPFGSSYTPQEWAARGRHDWMVIARLRDGVSLGQADAEMRSIGVNLAREYPETNEKVGAFVAPLRDHFVAGHRLMLFVLLGTVVLILLIACANLANLLLSRAGSRSKEVAVRVALGAGVWRLSRQFLCESLLVCLAGSALGLVLAMPTFRLLAQLAPGSLSGLKDVSLDWRVLGFTLAVTAITATIFGLLPLFQIRRLELNHSLKQSARSVGATAGSRKLRSLLIYSEVALAFVLLIGAGLLLRTFKLLRGVDVGCRTRNVLTLKMPVTMAERNLAKSNAFQREVLRRVEVIPGVISAGFTNHIPLTVKGDVSSIGAEGHDERKRFQCNHRIIGPGYLRTMGIALLRGRDIDERDNETAPRVTLINETLARTLWPGQDPIGRRVRFGSDTWVPVVGVVGDIHQSGLDVPSKPEFYVSSLQEVPWSLAIHTSVEPTSLAPAVRRAIWSVNPDLAITDLASMEQILDEELSGRRVQTDLLSAFAALGLLLAAVGLYGVLAYLVGQQIPEIGIRMALGAEPSTILRRVVARGLQLTAIGLVLGAVGALFLSRLLTSVLYGVKPTDPLTYVAVAVALLIVAALACYIPARRASKVDPVVALRCE